MLRGLPLGWIGRQRLKTGWAKAALTGPDTKVQCQRVWAFILFSEIVFILFSVIFIKIFLKA